MPKAKLKVKAKVEPETETKEIKPVMPWAERRGHKERTYWSKSSEHTMTKEPAKYDGTGALRVRGETIQFRDHVVVTNRASIQKYIEESDDFGIMVFATAEEAGLLQPTGEKVVSVMGANVGDMTPTEKGIEQGGSRTYKATDVEYEDPPPDAPEELE